MVRTLQAMRQRIYAALTTPPLSYSINAGPQQTVPANCVVPRSVWEVDDLQPDPFIAYAIAGRESSRPIVERWEGDRALTLSIWIVSSHGIDEPTEIYEAVRGVLNYADQEQIRGGRDLSVAATATNLPIAVREIREVSVTDPAFEHDSNRWYLFARYAIVAL